MKPVLITVLLAFVAAILTGFFARTCTQKPVEISLQERVEQSGILDTVKGDVAVSFDHLTGSVTGEVESEEERERVLTELQDAIGAGRLEDKLTIASKKEAPSLVATREGRAVTLSGVVAAESIRERFGKLARNLRGVESVQNDLRIGKNITEFDDQPRVEGAVNALLGSSTDSSFRLRDGKATLRGELSSPNAREDLFTRLGDVTADTSGITIAPPQAASLTLSSAIVDEEEELTVGGLVYDPGLKNSILETVKSSAGEEITINDEIRVDSHVTNPGWIPGATDLIETLVSEFESPVLVLSEGNFSVGGESSDESALTKLKAQFPILPESAAKPTFDLALVEAETPEPKSDPEPTVAPIEETVEMVGKKEASAGLPFVLNVGSSPDGVLLEGSIPSAEQRAAIVAAAKESLGDDKVQDRLIVSKDTLSEPWMTDLPRIVGGFLATADEGAGLIFVDGEVKLTGAVSSAESKEKILDSVEVYKAAGGKVRDSLTIDESMIIAMKTEPKYVGPTESEEAPEPVVEPTTNKPESTEMAAAEVEKEAVPEPRAEVAMAEPKPESKPQPEPKVIPETVVETKKPAIVREKVDVASGPIRVFFETNSAAIEDGEQYKIAGAVKRATREGARVSLVGYADFRGSFLLNKALTLERMEAVKRALLEAGVPESAIVEFEAKSDLESEKIDYGARQSDEELRRSRRVVIQIFTS